MKFTAFYKAILPLLTIFIPAISNAQDGWTRTEHETDNIDDKSKIIWFKPDLDSILKYKKMYPTLLVVSQKLFSVNLNQLPTKRYEKKLLKFDSAMHNLFDEKTEGVSWLVLTSDGFRHYFFYISDSVNYTKKIESLKVVYPKVQLEFTYEEDHFWKYFEGIKNGAPIK